MVLLNTADNVYLGAAAVSKVYLGANLVWSAPAGGSAPVIESFTVANNSSTTVNVGKPTGTVEGDLLLLFAANDLDNTTATPPEACWEQEGFTSVFHSSVGTFRIKNRSVLYKWAGPSEPSTYTFSPVGVSDDKCVTLLRISGAHATWNDTISAATQTVNDPTPASVDITPTVDNCLVIQVLFAIQLLSVDDTTPLPGYDGEIIGSPGSPPLGSSSQPYIEIAYKAQTTAAATGSADWWASNTDSGTPVMDSEVVALAVAPA